MRKAQGLYIISVAASLLEMHPQTLRKYEREGFIEPPRMGTLRLYSQDDIARLRLIKYLVEDLELNLAGVELALDVASKLIDIRRTLLHQGRGEVSKENAVKSIDEILKMLGVEITDEAEAPPHSPAGSAKRRPAAAGRHPH